MDVDHWLRFSWPATGIVVRSLGVYPSPTRRRRHGPLGRELVEYHLLVQLAGRAEIVHPAGSWELAPGAMLLLPASVGAAHRGLATGAEHLFCDFLVHGPDGEDPLAALDLPLVGTPAHLPRRRAITRRWRTPYDAVHADEAAVLAARRDALALLDAWALAVAADLGADDLLEPGLPACVRQAIHFMRQRFPSRRVRLRDIAREAGVAESTLSRAFAAHLDASPWAWFTDLRLDAAARLGRAEPHVPWPIIAERCGFGDYRHFARLFRRHCGQTPADWRHRL